MIKFLYHAQYHTEHTAIQQYYLILHRFASSKFNGTMAVLPLTLINYVAMDTMQSFTAAQCSFIANLGATYSLSVSMVQYLCSNHFALHPISIINYHFHRKLMFVHLGTISSHKLLGYDALILLLYGCEHVHHGE